jgi:hypothetical protein
LVFLRRSKFFAAEYKKNYVIPSFFGCKSFCEFTGALLFDENKQFRNRIKNLRSKLNILAADDRFNLARRNL